MNKYFFIFLTIWQGAPASSYVPGHNLSHHKYLQTKRDITRTTKVQYKSQLLNLLAFFPSIVVSIQQNDMAYMGAQKKKGRSIYYWFIQEVSIFHVVLIGLFILDWQRAFMLYFLPGLLAKDWLLSLNILQHDGCDPKHKYNHSRNFCSNILNYFLFNNGFHTIHHMMPGVHWSLTREKHNNLVVPYIHPNLLEPSILGYIVKAHCMGRPRINYDGTPYTSPGINGEIGEDEPWHYETAALNAEGSVPLDAKVDTK